MYNFQGIQHYKNLMVSKPLKYSVILVVPVFHTVSTKQQLHQRADHSVTVSLFFITVSSSEQQAANKSVKSQSFCCKSYCKCSCHSS